MKKRLIALLLSITLVTALTTGCGNKDKETEVTESVETVEDAEEVTPTAEPTVTPTQAATPTPTEAPAPTETPTPTAEPTAARIKPQREPNFACFFSIFLSSKTIVLSIHHIIKVKFRAYNNHIQS